MPRLSASLEERSVGSRGEPPRSDVAEDSTVPEVCLQQCLALKLKVGTLRIFFNLQEAVSGKPRPGRFTPGNNPVPIV